MSTKKICFIVASPVTASAFLSGHMQALSHDYEVHLVCDLEKGGRLDGIPQDVQVASIGIQRKFSPVADLMALVRLVRHFSSHRYDIICSVTPKAGLLGMLAGFLSRSPCRIHIFTGQVWVTRSGLVRWGLKTLDQIVAWLATDLLTDSNSQREFLIGQQITRPEKIQVLADGSICGVDTERFKISPVLRLEVRHQLGLPLTATVILFLGRINRDKGVLDLASAFARLAAKNETLWLLLVGPDEEDLSRDILQRCKYVSNRLVFGGFTSEPEKFMSAADIFALPSYREGFGTSVIEAAACGLPCVCSRIYGLSDAVVDGITGLLHKPADIVDIERQLEVLLLDERLRLQLGESARRRAVDEFGQKRLTDSFKSYVDGRIHSTRSMTGLC
jgi:glycosyltransferase involved in cell wall biosynthesis